MAYDNSSRMEPKRSHQWFMDGSEAELFPNKKQAVEVPNNNSFLGISNSNLSPWGNASSFQSVSGHFTERLFDSESARTINFDDRNMTSVSTGNMNMGRKVVEDPFGNDSTFGLSMSHTLEDPRSGLNYGGIRKVKVSQVKDSENVMPVSMGHAYTRGDNNTMSMAHAYNKADDNSISMGLTYNKGDDNIISMGDTYDREDNNFISMGPSYNKGDDNISIGHAYKGNNNTMSMGHTFSKSDNNVISMGQTYSKGDDNTISMGDTFSKGDNTIISMGQAYSKGDENTISMGQIYSKADDNTISMGQTYNKCDNNNLSMGHLYNKGDSNIISFGGYDDDTNPSGRLICSYDLLMGQPSVQRSEALSEKELVESNADALVSTAQIASSGNETVSKKKEDQKMSKKDPPNSFPSNVRSLLSTGMLDGVPVKYIAWSREVNHSSHVFIFHFSLPCGDFSGFLLHVRRSFAV